MDKVQVIKRSLRCLSLAWWALVPGLGILPAVAVILASHRIRLDVGEAWNPAERHLFWAVVIAWCGLGLSAVALGVALIVVLASLL